MAGGVTTVEMAEKKGDFIRAVIRARRKAVIFMREHPDEAAIARMIIALGDSSYANFCGGGKQFDALLQEQSAQRVGEMLLIDAGEHPEPESESNPWVEHWATLLN